MTVILTDNDCGAEVSSFAFFANSAKMGFDPRWAPIDIQVTQDSNTSRIVTWNPPEKASEHVTAYDIWLKECKSRDANSDAAFELKASVEVGSDRNQLLDGLIPGKEYEVKICAISSSAKSPFKSNSPTNYLLNLLNDRRAFKLPSEGKNDHPRICSW